jgi:hypothetical protein
VLPGIAAAEFALRRKRLSEQLPTGSVAIIPAARQVYMAGVIPYPYRPDADFLYLTGVQQVRGGASSRQACAAPAPRALPWQVLPRMEGAPHGRRSHARAALCPLPPTHPPQPAAMAVLRPDSNFTLVVPDADPWKEQWDGARLSEDAAAEFFGADHVATASQVGADFCHSVMHSLR